jgi:outer membrane protein TolC
MVAAALVVSSSAIPFTSTQAQSASAAPTNPSVPTYAYLDAMRQTLVSAPTLTVASVRAQTVANEVQRARAKHLPTLNVNSGLGSSRTNAGVTASVNLWAAGGIEAQISQQRALFGATREGLRQVCGDALVQASDAYVSVVRADGLVSLLHEHLAEYDSIQTMVQQIAAVDTGRRIDVEQVLTRKGLVQLQLLDAQSLARQARLNLSRLAGVAMEPIEASLAPVSQSLLPSSMAQALDEARAASPAIAAARGETDSAVHGVDVARAARFPQLNVVGNSTRDRSPTALRERDDRVSLQAQWNLFNGGSDFYAERSSLQAVEAAKAREEEVKRALELEVSQTWEAMAAARARGAQQQDQSRPARAVLDANRELFRLGRRSVLDILNAANDVHAVRTAALDARHELHARSLRLQVLTGALLPQVGVPATSACGREGVTIPASFLDHVVPLK